MPAMLTSFAKRSTEPSASKHAVGPGDRLRRGYGHGGLTFSSESKARRFDPAPGHRILGVHSDDPEGFAIIRPRRLSVIGTSVTPRHI